MMGIRPWPVKTQENRYCSDKDVGYNNHFLPTIVNNAKQEQCKIMGGRIKCSSIKLDKKASKIVVHFCIKGRPGEPLDLPGWLSPRRSLGQLRVLPLHGAPENRAWCKLKFTKLVDKNELCLKMGQP